MADAARELFNALDREHPDYTEWKGNWTLFQDVIGDDDPPSERMRDYLPQGEFETDDVYNMRLNLAEWVPESGNPINKLVGAVYNSTPTREYRSDFLEKEFSQDVDFKRTKWPDFTEKVARRLLGYGTIRLLVNINSAGLALRDPEIRENLENQELTVEQERALNIRPYLIDYSPLSIIDWETDQFDNLLMVRIKEEKFVAPLERSSVHDKIIRFIEYRQNDVSWWEFRIHKDKLTIEQQEKTAQHNLGMVPMIVENYPSQVRPMIGKSFIRYIARNDKRKIRAESDLDFDNYIHSHPTIVYKGNDELDQVGVGATTYQKIKPGEELGYMELPTSQAENIERLIDRYINAMHRHAGTDPLGVVSSDAQQFQASGVSRAWSFGTSESRILKDIASTMERLETSILDLVERWRTPQLDTPRDPSQPFFVGEVKYPEEFDPSSAHQLMEGREKAGEIVNSPTLHKTLDKRIATSLVGEVSQDTLEKITDEIEKNDPLDQGGSASVMPVTPMPRLDDFVEEESSETA